jgi:hypothetical protein
VGAELPHDHDHDHLHHDHDAAHHNYYGANHYELVHDYNDLGNVDEHDDHHLPLKRDDNPHASSEPVRLRPCARPRPGARPWPAEELGAVAGTGIDDVPAAPAVPAPTPGDGGSVGEGWFHVHRYDHTVGH